MAGPSCTSLGRARPPSFGFEASRRASRGPSPERSEPWIPSSRRMDAGSHSRQGLGLQRVALSGGTPLDVADKAAARGGTWGTGRDRSISRESSMEASAAFLRTAAPSRSHAARQGRRREEPPVARDSAGGQGAGLRGADGPVVGRGADRSQAARHRRAPCPHPRWDQPSLRPDGTSRLRAGAVAVRRALRPRAPRGDGPAGRDGPRRLHRDERRRRCGVRVFGAARLRPVELDPEPPPPDARRPARNRRTPERPSGGVRAPAISPDGTRIAIMFDAAISIFDVPRRTFTPLTSGPRASIPVWSPDGKRVFFASEKNGPWNIFSRPADGSAPESALWPSRRLPGSRRRVSRRQEPALRGRRSARREDSRSRRRRVRAPSNALDVG